MKDKQKVVKVIGAADAALTLLEETVHALQARGRTPAKADAQLLRSIKRSLNALKSNPFAGQSVQHALWPGEFRELPNLFRMELSGFWRLPYYVTGDEVMIVSVVFEICDHKKYDKIFGYKRR